MNFKFLKVILRLAPVNGNVAHLCRPGPHVHLQDKFFQQRSGSLDNDFNFSIEEISYISLYSESGCMVMNEIPESHALNEAADDYMRADFHASCMRSAQKYNEIDRKSNKLHHSSINMNDFRAGIVVYFGVRSRNGLIIMSPLPRE